MNKQRLYILTSPAFTAALCLLLTNDFILRPLFHNWLTGKVSDFAGLFAFPLFWTAFLPRYKKAIYALTAISFLLWKSVYSQPFLDLWNSLTILPLSRTVDVTDLMSLVVLPLSYYYDAHKQQGTSYRFAPYFLAALSLFAFTATSYRTNVDYDNKYYFQDSAITLTRKLYHLGHIDQRYLVSPCSFHSTEAGNIEIRIPANVCFDTVEATIDISEEQGQSLISLKKMQHRCPEGRNDKKKLLDVFEKELITKLKDVRLDLTVNEANNAPVPPAQSQLHGKGQLYFVPIGDVPNINIDDLAKYFMKKYGVRIRMLPKLPITDEVRSPGFPGSRPVASRVIEYMAGKYPKVVENSTSILIGVTDDMYVEQTGNQLYNFTLNLEGRFAAVAVERMRPSTFCEPVNAELLEARLRKVIARTIGTLYFRLPKSDNPKSVLYSSIGCVDEIDNQSEDF